MFTCVLRRHCLSTEAYRKFYEARQQRETLRTISVDRCAEEQVVPFDSVTKSGRVRRQVPESGVRRQVPESGVRRQVPESGVRSVGAEHSKFFGGGRTKTSQVCLSLHVRK